MSDDIDREEYDAFYSHFKKPTPEPIKVSARHSDGVDWKQRAEAAEVALNDIETLITNHETGTYTAKVFLVNRILEVLREHDRLAHLASKPEGSQE